MLMFLRLGSWTIIIRIIKGTYLTYRYLDPIIKSGSENQEYEFFNEAP